MSELSTDPDLAEGELPQAKLRARRWRLPVVWVVPVVAAMVAGYLVYERVDEFGPTITIGFKDGSGLRSGQTPVKYRGVPIGEVTAVELSPDQQHVLVRARLQRSAASIAREGTMFWIVRPEVGVASVTGLGTVISGPEIDALPGTGESRSSEFVGRENPPVTLDGKGLRIVLVSSRVGFLRPSSPVYYRGVEVGAVEDSQLSRNATAVDIHVVIPQRYAKLVRKGSKFWNASGAQVKASLFRGMQIKVESLRSLVAGGIAFATPSGAADEPAKNGTMFRLYDEPKKEWLEWTPAIPIPAEEP